MSGQVHPDPDLLRRCLPLCGHDLLPLRIIRHRYLRLLDPEPERLNGHVDFTLRTREPLAAALESPDVVLDDPADPASGTSDVVLDDPADPASGTSDVALDDPADPASGT